MNTNVFCFPSPSWKHNLAYTGGFFDEWGVTTKAGNANIEMISNVTWMVTEVTYEQLARVIV